jgi:hypothetical protein
LTVLQDRLRGQVAAIPDTGKVKFGARRSRPSRSARTSTR